MRNVTNRKDGQFSIIDPVDTTKSAAITNAGRLTVDIDTITQNPLKVTAPIMNTHYFIDDTEVTYSCSDTEDTVFKTWDYENSFLKGLMVVIEKKETIIKFYKNSTDLLCEVNLLKAEDLFQLNSTEPLHPMFSLYKNSVGVYICKLSFDNSPFDKIEVKLRHAETGSKDLKIRYGILIYNKIVVV